MEREKIINKTKAGADKKIDPKINKTNKPKRWRIILTAEPANY